MKVVLAFLAAIIGYCVLNRIIKPLPLGRWAMGLKWICAVLICIIMWIQSETSIGKDWATIQTMERKYQLLNITTIAMLFTLTYLLCCKIGTSCLVTTIVISIISLVNYYTILYHGMPFSVLDLKNARTAANVFGS